MTKFHHAYVYASIYAVDEWIFKEAGKSRARNCDSLHALQLLSDSSHFARHAIDGSRISDHVWSLDEVIALLD